jgi:hypothetical protein
MNDTKWTPIFYLFRTFGGNRASRNKRTQFPVIEAEAITVHKSQSCTFNQVVLTLTKNDRSLTYVACRRVKSLDCHHITNQFIPPTKPKPDDKVFTEINRLKTQCRLKFSLEFLQDQSGLKIMYQNIESINSHYQDLLNEKSFMAADIIYLVETHNEGSIDYKIPGYYCIYNSNKQPSIKIHG